MENDKNVQLSNIALARIGQCFFINNNQIIFII